jgi:hypothetical protein
MRRGVLATRSCGRKARFTFQTYVGLTRSHYVCGDDECTASITQGYGANNWRELA